MAKKLDVNIDAGNFLEAFRPELPPSATRRDSGKETGNGTAAEPTRESGGEKRARPVKQTAVPIEEEYLERFIRTSRTPARSGKMAYVCKGIPRPHHAYRTGYRERRTVLVRLHRPRADTALHRI